MVKQFSPQKVDGLTLRHITTLYNGGPELISEGYARCSKKDVYTWLYGIRAALGFAVINHLCSGIEESSDPYKVWIAGKSYLIPGDKRELWGKFHKAFFTEMRKAPTTAALVFFPDQLRGYYYNSLKTP